MVPIGFRICLNALALLPCLLLAGCKADDLGVSRSSKEALSVHPSWIQAARSCWPELNASDGIITHNLVDPEHLRTIFSAYAGESDADLRNLVGKPILDAPEPDRSVLLHSATQVLTRQQAVEHADPRSARRPETGLPEDALCSIQSGTPIGFK